MANDQSYLIPLDNDNFKKSVIGEDLLNHIIHGRQLAVLNYDFEALEKEQKRADLLGDEFQEMMQDQYQHNDYVSNRMATVREYQYYYPNRDYGDDLEHLQVKKVDNGEFWDNGYR